MSTKNSEKNTHKYYCPNCDYYCSQKSDWIKHNTTNKHLGCVASNDFQPKKSSPLKNVCGCGKAYTDRSGLWRHKKKCNSISSNSNSNSNSNNELLDEHAVIEIIKQNQGFKEFIVEQSKQNQELTKQIIELSKEKVTNITNNNTNCNNKFNLQIFLNENCKDALNLTDFIDSLKLSLTDLENVGSLGFVEGISNIFVKGLKQLDIYKRPIHCSDLKREILYIKNSDAWEKENHENDYLKKAIKTIANKNMRNISDWKEANPECSDGESQKNDQYMDIITESFTKESDEDNYKKIIKRVAKNVVIDKM